MKKLVAIILFTFVIVPVSFGFVGKKTSPAKFAVTSIIYFHLATEDIADVDTDFVGCKLVTRTTLAQVAQDTCRIPSGVQLRFLQFGVHIPIVDLAISPCDLYVAVDGVNVTATKITMGGTDLDEVGEFKVVTLATPAWYPSGSEYTFKVDTSDGGCADGSADLKRVTMWTKIETELE